MPANTAPLFALTPNVNGVIIPTTNAVVKNDGTSAGSGTDLLYKVFTAGANGSWLDRIVFRSTATTANTSSIATVLRMFISSISSPGACTTSDTHLLEEFSAPAVTSDHSTNAGQGYVIQLGIAIPTGWYVHVCQHVAQTTNQHWQALAIGGDY